jgi:hypothetical protein
VLIITVEHGTRNMAAHYSSDNADKVRVVHNISALMSPITICSKLNEPPGLPLLLLSIHRDAAAVVFWFN